MGRLFSAFILPMEKKIKNLKISIESHDILKKYCDKHGIKMYRFLENLIKEKYWNNELNWIETHFIKKISLHYDFPKMTIDKIL